MFVVAADIGQARDPTAIVGLEATEEGFDLQHLERLPLGTPYPLTDHLDAVCGAVPVRNWWSRTTVFSIRIELP